LLKGKNEMPLTILHSFVGAATGVSFYLLERSLAEKEIDSEALKRSALIGGIAGALPDILEPPLHRWHRRFFHSYAAFAAAAVAFSASDSFEQLDEEARLAMRTAIAAYLSHLALDSRTPMSLPLML